MITEGERPRRDDTGRRRRSQQTAAEWTIFGISAALILAVVAVLLTDWVAGTSGPPRFSTAVKPVRAFDRSFQVPVSVRNVGDKAAREVRVAAKLALGGGEVIEAQETVDVLAPRQTATLIFVFDRDPRMGELSVSVRAYREP